MAADARDEASGAESEYDVVVVGASLAGCTLAMLLGREGVRVALLDKCPDVDGFKRLCGHYLQPSGIATIERLGLMAQAHEASAVRSRVRLHTEWGLIAVGDHAKVPPGLNLRREVLDPMIRRAAATTDGVDLALGLSVDDLLRDNARTVGVLARDRRGERRAIRAKLVVGADGRGSRVAQLAGAPPNTYPNGRFSYAGYFEGPPPADTPDCTVWMLNPEWAGAFPTDGGLTMYACMPCKERIPEFRQDPSGALRAYIAALPDPPPITASRQVGKTIGALDLPIITHDPTLEGVALIGDAALAADPMFAVGCSWALQSAEWLADSVAPALKSGASIRRALARYRRRHRRATRSHNFIMRRLSVAEPLHPRARLIFAAASRDNRLAAQIEQFSARSVSPMRFVTAAVPRAVAVSARARLSRTAQAERPTLETAAESGEEQAL